MIRKHILICDDDLVRYPPLVSIIKILLQLNLDVTFLGYCRDKRLIKSLTDKGLNYEFIEVDKVQKNNFSKFITMFIHTNNVLNYLKKNNPNSNSLVWVFGNENGWRLNKVLKKYKSILYLFEFPFLKIPAKYKFVVPFLNLKKSIQSSWRVVCCEYNRAQITKAYFGLEVTPTVIPNKPFVFENESFNTPKIENKFFDKIPKNKKIILYQGAINISERKVDVICDTIKYLDSDYVICIMGADGKDKSTLISKHSNNDRIIFLPFLSPPSHLYITRMAYIGIVGYHTNNSTIEHTLNLLYCAPNKIFEYSKYGIPMVSNDLPALNRDFLNYGSGLCCNNFTPSDIANAINKISNNYEKFSEGSKKLYHSIDIKELITKLIQDV